MALTLGRPFNTEILTAFNPVAGTPNGAIKTTLAIPTRSRLMEVGFTPQSLVASAMTMTVIQWTPSGSTAVTSTQVVSSTTGTFSSANLLEGMVASVPLGGTLLNQGDVIEIVTSGGNTSAIGATIYAVIQPS